MPIIISMLYPKLFVKDQSKSKKNRDLKKGHLFLIIKLKFITINKEIFFSFNFRSSL